MNEINFEIQDIEKIDLSMDVGVKEIYPPIENLEVTPNKEQQVFNHENSYGYDEVIVNSIPEEYIIPDGTLDVNANGDVDVTMFRMARVGVYTPPNLQDKEITINENGTHNIVADEEYDGLNQVSVTVNAIEDLTEELNTYDTELTEQETKMADVIELLQTKATPSVEKYAPRYLRFSGYTGTELNYELANLDTSNITTFSNMFSNCANLTSFILEDLNTSNVTNIDYLFQSCSLLTSVVLRNLDISNITSMVYMFSGCKVLNSVVFDNIDTSKITEMRNMFSSCSTTTSLDLSTLDTSSVTDMYNMFNGCTSLQFLDIRKFDFSNVTRNTGMFTGVPSNCVIIVKDDTSRRWIQKVTSNFTIRTVAEWEAEQ